MQLSTAGILVDARGLAASEARFGALRTDTFAGLLKDDLLGSANLTPGEEVAIQCEIPDLPRNADVKEMTAVLTITRAATTAGEPTSVTITTGSGNGSKQEFGVGVTPSGLPSNVQVRLEQGDPLWSHTGTLDQGQHDIPDFARQVNAYLDKVELPPNAPTTLRFLVKSDTPGSVSIDVRTPVDYSLLQTQTWPNQLDGSVSVDRNLELDFGGVSQIALDSLAGQAPSITRHTVALDLSGTLGPERMLGALAAHDGIQYATISGDYFVAQAIRLDDPNAALGFAPGTKVNVAGVTGVVEVDAEAELYVEIQPGDASGPASGQPLTKLTTTLKPPDAGAARRWAFAAFESPAELAVDTDYWIVFKGIRGSARLGLASVTGGYLGRPRVNRGGQLWRPIEGRTATAAGNTSHLAAVARLVYLPAPDIQTAALELTLSGSPTPQLATPAGTVQRVSLPAAGDTGTTTLVLRSHAHGSVTVTNVVQEFARTTPGARQR